MCRLTAYMGPSLALADVVTRPERSVIRQSFDARERLGGSGGQVYDVGALNADGFGLGWYPDGQQVPAPCVFSEVGPAWNNRNLINLAAKISSRLIFAHVRAAGPGMGICKCSCHPFEFGRYLFMHNGQVSGFRKVRRRILDTLNQIAFNYAIENSCSDSALAFAVFIDQLPEEDPCGLKALSPDRLQEMVQNTIAVLCRACEEAEVDGVSLLNFVVSDGENMIATRYVHVRTGAPEHLRESARAASLYFASGSSFEPEEKPVRNRCASVSDSESDDGEGNCESEVGCAACNNEDIRRYRMMRRDLQDNVVIITSEPLTETRADWVSIPQNHIVLVTGSGHLLMSPMLQTDSLLCKASRLFAEKNVSQFQAALQRFGLGPRVIPGDFVHSSRRSVSAIDCDGPIPSETSPSSQVSWSSSVGVTTSPPSTGGLSLDTTRENQYPNNSPPEHVMRESEGSPILAVAIFGQYLFSADGSGAGKLCIWDLALWKCVKILQTESGTLAMTACDERKLLFVACTDNTIYTWSIITEDSGMIKLRPAFRLSVPDAGHILTLAFQHDSNKLLVGSQDCNVRSILLPKTWTKNERLVIEPVAGLEDNFLLDPDRFPAFQAVSASSYRPAQFQRRHSSHLGYVHAVVVCQDMYVTGGGDGFVKLWDRCNTLIETFSGHRAAVFALCTSALSIFSGSSDCTVRVWDLETRACRRVLLCSAPVLCLSIVNSTKPLLVCSLADETLCLWSLRTFQLNERIANPHGKIFSIAVATITRSLRTGGSALNGTTKGSVKTSVACGTSNGSIVLWNIRPSAKAFRRQWSNIAGASVGIEERLLSIEENIDSVALDDDCEDVLIETLRELIRIRSVSANPTYLEECWFCARVLARLLEKFGCEEVKMAFDESVRSRDDSPTLPVILATLKGNRPQSNTDDNEGKSRKRIVFYGHYDVVEAVASSWNTDPWEMAGENGYLYGRGCTDNKGPMLACFFAARCLQAAADLPCDVTFIFEGQEECGMSLKDRSFANVIHSNSALFENTVGVIISNNYWIDDVTPCLTYGMRGAIDFSVTVDGPEKDLHAGVHGGCVFETCKDLIGVLHSLTNEDGSLAVPKLLEQVRPVSARETENLQKTRLEVSRYAEEVGVSHLRCEDSLKILKSRWCEPSVSISDLKTSNLPQHFRRIPSSASARLSLHFVPDQNPDEVEAAIREHLTSAFQKRNSANRLKIDVRQVSDWWLGKTDGELYKIAHEAIKTVWNCDPLYVREGGSYGGISAFLENSLKAPVIHLPMGQATDSAHLPNERICLENLLQGKAVVQEILRRVEFK